jgi:hypothetical protein
LHALFGVAISDSHPYVFFEGSGQAARQKYHFDGSLFATNGNIIFAQNINQVRDATVHPELAVSAGQINAMGLNRWEMKNDGT